LGNQKLYRRMLRKAMEQAGDVDALAKRLGMSSTRLRAYDAGEAEIPEKVFLRIVDLLEDSGRKT
jgi:ribosome-binding protein aMBF1 (putative translation factor)